MISPNSNKAIAFLYALITLILLGWAIGHFKDFSSNIDPDLFSLLPDAEKGNAIGDPIKKIAKNGENSLMVLIGDPDIHTAIAAAAVFRSHIADLPLTESKNAIDIKEVVNFYKPYQQGLLTHTDEALLNTATGNFWFDKSSALAYSPMGALVPWKDDPFGLFNDWLNALGDISKVRPYQNNLVIEKDGIHYVLIPLETTTGSFSTSWQKTFIADFDLAIKTTQSQFPNIAIYKSGVVLHVAASSRAAESEITTIGCISLLAAFILICMAFRSPYAIGSVLVVVGVAFFYASLLTMLFFSKIYLLTLVFGTSLIGMSVDYCFYWLTASIDSNESTSQKRSRLFPGMALALITTFSGYLLLAFTPFPIFSQMAIFSMGGIVSAWLAVMLWFPHIRRLNFRSNPFFNAFQKIQPGIGVSGISKYLICFGIAIASGYGLLNFKVNDDIRSLIALDANLVNEQLNVSNILSLPSPSQFFIVSGDSPQAVLQKTGSLLSQLDESINNHVITGYQSIAQLIPSTADQERAQHLTSSTAWLETLHRLQKTFELPKQWVADQHVQQDLLTFEHFKNSPLFEKLGFLWFEQGDQQFSTAVLLTGIVGKDSLGKLAALADPSINWVDKPQEISNLFSQYRLLFSWLVLLGYAITFVALWLRYKKESWRAVLPPILATFLTITLLSGFGQPIGLLSILAFAFLLGVGTDYGIFLLEYPSDRRMVFSISMGALMTLISFGSLSLSRVPALHGFGLTLLFGISLTWILTLFFARKHSR